MNKLKPCPFCGQSDKVIFEPPTSEGMWFQTPGEIGCRRCGFHKTVYIVLPKKETDEEAGAKIMIDWWNTRKG